MEAFFKNDIKLFYSIVRAALPGVDKSTCEEIVHDVYIELIAKADEYDVDRSFMPWIREFLRRHVLRYRSKLAKQRMITLDVEKIELLLEVGTRHSNGGSRMEAFQECLRTLAPEEKRELDNAYLFKSDNIRNRAADRGVKPSKLYKKLHEIREKLRKCVELRMGQEV